MFFGKKLILALTISITIFTVPTLARSLYVITDHTPNGTFTAYDINDEQIVNQTSINIYHGTGPTGLALDGVSRTLFSSFDGPAIIEIINARMMKQITNITAPAEIAGMAYDESQDRLYALERQDKDVYVYRWEPISATLTLDGPSKSLQNIQPYPQGAYGIALDESENRAYVSDDTNVVKIYDTNNLSFTYKGSVSIVVDSNSRKAVAIEFYRDGGGNKYLYTGGYAHTTGDHNSIVRTNIDDINTPSSVEYDVGAQVVGIAADASTGLIYATTQNNTIEIYNNATFPSDPCYTDSNDISGPADIIVRGDVSYKPSLLKLEKTDDANGRAVIRGEYINYTITYGNPNDVNVTTVDIIDHLPDGIDTNEVTFSGGGDYNSTAGTVTWNDLNLPACPNEASVWVSVKSSPVATLSLRGL